MIPRLLFYSGIVEINFSHAAINKIPFVIAVNFQDTSRGIS